MYTTMFIRLSAGLVSGLIACWGGAVAQQTTVPQNWHLLDKVHDGVWGIGINSAYTTLLKGKTPRTVLVAVIDSGIDTLHEDLRPVLWHNPGEQNNGRDNDGNGYKGDVFGWNFIGDTADVHHNLIRDSDEGTRFYYAHKSRFAKVTDERQLAAKDRKLYGDWLRSARALARNTEAQRAVDELQSYLQNSYPRWDTLFQRLLAMDTYTGKEVEAFTTDDRILKMERFFYARLFAKVKPGTTNKTLPQALKPVMDSMQLLVKIPDTPPADYRAAVVKDDYFNLKDRFYGNSNVMAENMLHGTHASGIIGAVRNNGIGVDGIADNVQLMMVRVTPDGDEHDKDVALAIRYAVDNGAQIINMSFGKAWSPQQQWVEEAIEYARRKDVLIVKAAGNSGINLDSLPDYPANRYRKSRRLIPHMLTVGASGPLREELVSPFSNYGRETVDVFAPGMQVYSTVGLLRAGTIVHEYQPRSGTSMAAPVVTGIAAVLKAYYPQLSAVQIKQLIEASVTKVEGMVYQPQTNRQLITMAALCRTAGIVNAYRAVELAEAFTRGR